MRADPHVNVVSLQDGCVTAMAYGAAVGTHMVAAVAWMKPAGAQAVSRKGSRRLGLPALTRWSQAALTFSA
jgi:hypothetical protein